DQGGGASESALTNCTVIGNSAMTGGGADTSAMNNCILYYNTGANFSESSGCDVGDDCPPTPWLNSCCVMPMPQAGIGNITNAPLFVDAANGNFRLQLDSPCINAGNNEYVSSSTDLEGNPRISGGTVDMGAYEFVFTPSMLIAGLILQIEQANPGPENKQPLL